ncbi:MAG: NuoI/complex I 23 kDa subunit family protein [Candidatus Aminicenantia bacterium]
MFKALEYFLEILKGIWITSRHFGVNLFFHLLNLLGLKTKRKGAVTFQYPEQRKPLSHRHRSLHRLMTRENGEPRCVACFLCMTVCPSECIYLEAEEDPDPEIQKHPAKFIIDLSRCCFCGFCVEACPEDALRMDTNIVELAEYSRDDLNYDLNKLIKIERR